jgi:hypothetical protein
MHTAPNGINAEAFSRISALDFLAFTKGDLTEAQLKEKYGF